MGFQWYHVTWSCYKSRESKHSCFCQMIKLKYSMLYFLGNVASIHFAKCLPYRYSPVQTNEKPLLALRISSPSYQADGSLSRSPSPQGNAYAGPKFSEPPSPEVLPRPPTHWTSYGISFSGTGSCSDMSSQLKLLLKVASQQA